MRNIINILLIMTSVTLFSCATTGKYEEMLSTWVDHPSSELFSTWGAPDSSFTDNSGQKYYTFNRSGGAVGNTYFNPYGGATTYVSSYSCSTTFTVNSSDIIQRWSWKGNSCTAR